MDAPKARLSVPEYLALDAASEMKLEFIAGEVVAMSTPTRAHARIVANLMYALAPFVRQHGCDSYSENTKVHATATDDFAIPDVVVTCDHFDMQPRPGENIIQSPCLVIEVLSDGTAKADRTTKAGIYESIPSIVQYVLVDSRKRWVAVHERDPNGFFREPRQIADSLAILCLGDEHALITLDEIYARTSIPKIRIESGSE